MAALRILLMVFLSFYGVVAEARVLSGPLVVDNINVNRYSVVKVGFGTFSPAYCNYSKIAFNFSFIDTPIYIGEAWLDMLKDSMLNGRKLYIEFSKPSQGKYGCTINSISYKK